MVSSTLHSFLGLAGWSLIPDLATQHLLGIIHRFSSAYLHLVPPSPGTPAYRRHYAYTFALVVLGYLLYNMIQTASNMPPNFYEILGVGPDVDENGLKLAFRQFAKRNHPDRPEVGPRGEELFIMVRDVFEALKDPVVRFAYDRFGPDVLMWTQCKTAREYLQHGLMQASGYHIVAAAGLILWTAIGQPSPVSFWRYNIFAMFFALELALLLAPSLPSFSFSSATATTLAAPPPPTTPQIIFNVLFPGRVTYQHVMFLHQLFMFVSVALSRVAPQLFPDQSRIPPGLVEQLQNIAGVADREASLMLHTHLHSIQLPPPRLPSPDPAVRVSLARMRPLANPSPKIMNTLAREMEDMIIEANLKKDAGPLRGAWEAAVRSKGRGKVVVNSATAPGTAGQRNFWERREEDDKSDEEQIAPPVLKRRVRALSF